MKEIISELLDIYSPNKSGFYDDKSWNYLIEFCNYHELIPILYIKFNHLLPLERQQTIKAGYYLSIARNMVLMNEFLKLKIEFESRGIEFLPLKGIDFMNTLYPDINFRPMADIDILIAKQKLNDCEAILKALGYRKILAGVREEYWLKYHCHFMYYKISSGMNIHLEIHWALDFKRIKNITFERLWVRRREISVNDTKIYVLSPEDTLISLALHQRRFHKPLILKNIIDGYLIVKHYNIDWEYIIETAYRYRLRTTFNLFLNIIQQVYEINFKDIKDRLRINNFVDRMQNKIIAKYIYNVEMFNNYTEQKKVYLFLYLFLYDRWWELFYYLYFISPEKFAKFFNLPVYSFKNNLFYRLRLFYVPLKILRFFLKTRFK
jgi:hypothetical protein